MARHAALVSAEAKLKRSGSQIRNIETVIEKFYASKPYKQRETPSENGTLAVHWFELTKPIPSEIPIFIGEALHNMRSVTDEMLRAVVVEHGLPVDGIYFPSGATEEDFQNALDDLAKRGVHKELLAGLAQTKAFKGGFDVLWAIFHLTRRDGPGVVVHPLNVTVASRICVWRGIALVIGSKSGKHLTVDTPYSPADLLETGKPLQLYEARPSGVVLADDTRSEEEVQAAREKDEWFRFVFGDAGPIDGSRLDFLTTTPDSKFETDFKPYPMLTLHGVGIDGNLATKVLHGMRNAIGQVVKMLAVGLPQSRDAEPIKSEPDIPTEAGLYSLGESFIYRVETLRKAIDEPNDVNLIATILHLRNMLMDETPLLIQAQKQTGLKPRFRIYSIGPGPAPSGNVQLMFELCHISPQFMKLKHPEKRVKLERFLAEPVMRSLGQTFTVRDVIDYLAHHSGVGVHYVPTKQPKMRFLGDVSRVVQLQEMPAVLLTLRQIIAVVVEACAPLYEFFAKQRPVEDVNQ